MSLSRRGLFNAFLKPLKPLSERKGKPEERAAAASRRDGTQVAVIQGRFCLAYQGNYCAVCYEQCPVPGALTLPDGLPRVALETCTGCGICHDVCPAPENAILMTDRRPGVGG